MKKKKNKVPMMIIDDSQYKDEPINRDPDTSMEISEELQARLDEIRKNMTFKHMHNRMCFLFTPNTMYNELK